jgi:5-methyltetrahydropteroyltriglutamate--homocysteine methyltransferase
LPVSSLQFPELLICLLTGKTLDWFPVSGFQVPERQISLGTGKTLDWFPVSSFQNVQSHWELGTGNWQLIYMQPRSDVIGSLLRPAALLEARQKYEQGELTPAEFKFIEDRAVRDAVALQEDAGLDVVTDGEMRRYAFFGHLVEALEGFDKYGGWSITFRDGEGHDASLQRPVVVDKLRWRRQMSVEEFTYLRGRTKKPLKVTLVSAQQAAAYYDPDKSRGAYATRDGYLSDLVDFTRREIAELQRLGCEYIQIDAPQYAALLDETIREGYRQRGSDPDKMLDACIDLDNAIIAGHDGVTFGIHICRGNHKSMFYASGGYDRIAEQVFSRARFNRFLLEYDDARSGTFEPLRYVPEDRTVVLGLVSSKTPRLETRDEIRSRIDAAARVVPLERLALSPQCGFASTSEGNRLTADDQRRKLELVAQTAREVWG